MSDYWLGKGLDLHGKLQPDLCPVAAAQSPRDEGRLCLRRIILVCVGLFLHCLPAAAESTAGPAGAQSKTGFAFHDVEWERCYDGDTCFFTIPNTHPLLGDKIGVRLARCDAPEVSTKCEAEKAAADEARDALVERLRQATVIDLREVERGTYFRLVAEVIADGENLSDVLLARGLAWPYDGGTRERKFCVGMAGE